MPQNLQPDSGSPLISTSEAAAGSRFSREYIRRLCRRGDLAGEQINGEWFVSPASLDGFIARSKEQKEARDRELAQHRAREYRALNGDPAQNTSAAALIARKKSAAAQFAKRHSASHVFATSILVVLCVFSVALPFAIAMPGAFDGALAALTQNPMAQSAAPRARTSLRRSSMRSATSSPRSSLQTRVHLSQHPQHLPPNQSLLRQLADSPLNHSQHPPRVRPS